MTDALKAALATVLKPGEVVRWSELYTPPCLLRSGTLYVITDRRILVLKVLGKTSPRVSVKVSYHPSAMNTCEVTRDPKTGTRVLCSSGECALSIRTHRDETGLLMAFLALKTVGPSAAGQLGYVPEWLE